MTKKEKCKCGSSNTIIYLEANYFVECLECRLNSYNFSESTKEKAIFEWNEMVTE